MARTPKKPTHLDDYNHDSESRMNIPTAETSDFMTDEQREPTEAAYPRYRRDPALDPQLVWQGKDEADADDLRVWVHPIYVHEKVLPRAIVENVRAAAMTEQPAQMSLFEDYDGIDFEEQVEFYQHEQHWANRFILGDSMAVMASLAEKEGLRGKVQMIYLDPPYGIKFNSNWQPSTRQRDVKDGRDASYEPEQIRAFRDTWQDGIHSYLTYLRDRLRVARELLTDSGSVFVQIGDENVHLVRNLLDEVFGAENFVAQIPFKKTSSLGEKHLDSINDYLLWFSKDIVSLRYRQTYRMVEYDTYAFPSAELEDGSVIRSINLTTSTNARLFRTAALTSQSGGISSSFSFKINGREFSPSQSQYWKTNFVGMNRLAKAGRLIPSKTTLNYKRYIMDFPARAITNWWDDTIQSTFATENIYVVQTYSKVIERCMLMTTDPGDIVLDPTCGSGTTAYVAEQWGRRWITIDTSRVALALARTRLMSARFPMYTVNDPAVGPSSQFQYKTVPHITLKSIANNPRIDDIHERFQPALDELRAHILAESDAAWEEWEIPRPAPKSDDPTKPEAPLNVLLQKWWELRRDRQGEIDRAIAESADHETLYDQPEVVKGVVRVSGPFTVESLSPHRALGQDITADADNAQTFVEQMIEQLRAAGVKSTRKGDSIKFTQLDAYAGRYLNAAGTYAMNDQAAGRVAVVFGPQYGTVSKQLIVEAAKETVRDRLGEFDLLLVCGFAFDPEVTEAAKDAIGRIKVQTARISPDLLLMGKDLKKDGKGNLFTVFGEPDIETQRQPDGRWAVTLKGVDVYDPNQGSVRSSSTAEIACWFIDTNYDEANFFVRHAYFTGADKPYDKLKAALKSDINPEAWEALYRTESLPFDAPATGKIAVKVINHHGDEVMVVVEVGG
ncbi:MAG: site-specific DNA-methyltransferase [Anaerolineae bacterium]|jgi:adenine-specific DNA-methyltransferase|nr:site-specific DNA-methyltransferase [Anaerolineae bacterium]